MDKITAKVEFITPLLIGGASNKLDKNGLLRAASLRGVLRFWFRAIAGPIIGLGSNKDFLKNLHEYEDNLFGSTKKAVLKVRIFPKDKTIDTSHKFPLLPHKDRYKEKAYSQGIKNGAVFKIEIWERKRKQGDASILPVVASVLWLWGNLGAIGKRARRGFGSPIITELNINGSPLNGLPTISSFANPKKLKEHLNTGLNSVNKTIAERLNSSQLDLNQPELSCAPYFVLCETSEELVKLPDGIKFPEDLKNKIHYDNSNQLLIFKGIMSQEEKNKLLSLSTDDTYKKTIEALFQRSLCNKKQIFVGKEISNKNFKAEDGPIGILVKNTKKDPAFGSGNPRHASPVFIRYHEVNDKFVPVVTWCKQKMQKTPNNELVEKLLNETLKCECII